MQTTKRVTKKMREEAERAEAAAELREIVKPGATVYTVLRHVSKSGMSRDISLQVVEGDRLRDITFLAARAMGERDRFSKGDRAIRVGGCGMDMGFHLVYGLAWALFRDGFECIGRDCPSNDHSNGSRNYDPHPHSDPGYALRHEWV